MNAAPTLADVSIDFRGLDLRGLTGINLEQYCGLWAIDEIHFTQLVEHVKHVDLRAHVAANEGRDHAKAAVQTIDSGNSSRISIISVEGTMTKQGSSMSYAGSTVRIRQELRSAARDPSVSGILMRYDSPGGTVAGTADLAADIRAANESKPVFSFAEDLCASAAYWPGSQGEKFFANDATALIGSIGTFIGLYDLSQAAANEGIKAVVLRTGALKGTGFPGTEITDEQKAYLQEIVDQTQEQFTAAVAAGRDRPVSEVKKWATGRTWSATEALKMGLIDGIQSLDKTLAQLAKAGEARRKANAASSRKATVIMSTATTPAADTPTTPAADKPKPASAAEIGAACKGLNADANGDDARFVLDQLKRNATVEQAASAWMDTLAARLSARDEELAKAKAEKPADKPADKPAAGVDAVVGKSKPTTPGGGSAAEQWKAAIAEKVAAGMSHAKAASAVNRERPELREALVAEANPKTK